jgi:hypothetical protein
MRWVFYASDMSIFLIITRYYGASLRGNTDEIEVIMGQELWNKFISSLSKNLILGDL